MTWLIGTKLAINLCVGLAKLRTNPPLGCMFISFAIVDLTTIFLYRS